MLSEETSKRLTAEVTSFVRGQFYDRLRAALEQAYAQGYQDGRTTGLHEARETQALEDSYNAPDRRTLEDIFSEEARKAAETGATDTGPA